MSEAEEYIRQNCPKNIKVELIEFYNSNTKTFEVMNPKKYLPDRVRTQAVFVKSYESDSSELLQIEGRAFDISNGLSIGRYTLRIREQQNRSEGFYFH